ncbi:MAG: type VI secretion system protein TssA [Smithellaceae bacterium]
MNTMDDNWSYALIGKHPVARDYIEIGEKIPVLEELSGILDAAYARISSGPELKGEFTSWRFWFGGSAKDVLVCGIMRESSDAMGRPYPLVIAWSGLLKDWELYWDLLPMACDSIWGRFEYLATHKYDNIKKMQADLAGLRSPTPDWEAHRISRHNLNPIGSALDPYASFLDFPQLKKQAESLSERRECFVSLDRGPCKDKILQVSLWHHLFKTSFKTQPRALFLGGNLEKAFLAAFHRELKTEDLVQLWSVSSASLWKSTIGPEYSMDISSLGKEPICAERPAGADVRYDAAFSELQEEVDKLSLPSAAGGVNWEKVTRFAAEILAHKSKDLLVATSLAVSLIYPRRQDGFSIGVKLIMDLLVRFWEELYPPKARARGRLRSLEWWLEKSENALRQFPARSIPEGQARLIIGNLEQIEQLLRQHLTDAPSVRRLAELTQELAGTKIPEAVRPDRQPPPVEEVRAAAVPPPEPPAGPGEEIQSLQIAKRSLDQHFLKIREIAGYYLRQDAAAAVAYRLNRQAVWCVIEDMPPASGGKTRIPPPDKQVVKMLFELRDTGDAEALLKAAEGRLPQYIFWLDLNRFSAEALTRLGQRFTKALHAVCQETAFLLHRLPGLEELSFADGTPFANPETKQWLVGIAMDSGRMSVLDETVLPAAAHGDESIGADIAEAHALIRGGKMLEAIEKLQRKLNGAASSRERILWRLAIARLMLDVRQVKLAIPQMEQIVREIDHFRLEDYDPALALRGLKLVWAGLELQNDPSVKIKTSDVLDRIARIDMAEVIKLSKN